MFESLLVDSEVALSTRSYISEMCTLKGLNVHYKSSTSCHKCLVVETEIWCWRELWGAAEVQSVPQSNAAPGAAHAPQSNLHTNSWLPSSSENAKHIPVLMSWGFRLPCGSKLQCFTSTLLLVASWSSGRWETWSHWCFQLPQSLGMDGSTTVRHRMDQMEQDGAGYSRMEQDTAGWSRMQLCTQMSSLWSKLLHQGFDWMTGSELLTVPLSPTSSDS